MKHKKHRQQFQKKTFRLKDNHTWRAPDGYKIVVLDRGAVSFNVPHSWVVAKTQPFEMNDAEPPDDNARLTISFWQLPLGVDWSGLPLIPMLTESVKDSELHILGQSEVTTSARSDLELVWMQQHFMDPKEPREAYTRIALARGWDVQVLITFDFWVDDARKFTPVWDEVLRSLQLGRHIEDPTKGAVLH